MIPIILQNLITHTVTLADTFMVGMLGEQYMAAATMAATPLFMFVVANFGVQSGAGILVAQYWGKRNTDAINRVLGVGLYCSIAVTLTGAVIVSILPNQILGLITNDSSLVQIGVPYARIVGYAQTLSAISMIYLACQRSMENTRIGVVVLLISSVFNVFGNWVLIFGKLGMPALGLKGAAIATLCARAVEVIVISIYAFNNSRLKIKILLVLKPGIIIFKDYIKYSLPVLCEEALYGLGVMMFPVIFGHMFGAQSVLAAYTIAANLDRVLAVTVNASGSATAVIIGREIGAGRRDRVESVAKSLISMALIFGLLSGILLLIVRFTVLETFVYRLFDLSKEAASSATIMITILMCVIPLRTVGYTMGIGVLRGGGDVKAVLYLDIGTLYFIAIPMAAITGLVLKTGIAIVYLSFLFEEIGKVTIAAIRVKSKKWINDVTREQLE